MLHHYAAAASAVLRCSARHCCTELQPQVMRCTASAAAALHGGSSFCKAVKLGGQQRQAWGRCTAEIWSVHMWWWRCRWCAVMLIAVMKIRYSSCPEFKRQSVVWHQTDIFFNTLVLLKNEWSWQCQMREIQFSIRIFLSWTSNQIFFYGPVLQPTKN